MRIFGQQIGFAIDVIKAAFRPVDAGSDAKRRVELAAQSSRVVMQIVVSIVILGFGGHLLVTSSSDSVQKACVGFIGTVIGYWLR